MRTFWKWFFGILAVLVVIAALVGVGFWAFTQWRGGVWVMHARAVTPQERAWDEFPWHGMPGRNFRMPMQPFGRLPGVRSGLFSPISLILGGLFRLGLLALLVLGIVLIVRALQRPSPAPAVAAAPAAAPEPVAVAAAATCSSCGAPIQEGWKFCPACGNDQTT